MQIVANPLRGFGPFYTAVPVPSTGVLTALDNEDGTATFTITGTDLGSTNTLFIRSSNYVGNQPWVEYSPITSDGSWTVTLTPGSYYSYVQSVTVGGVSISNILLLKVVGSSYTSRWAGRRDAQFVRSGLPIVYKAFSSGSTDPRTGTVSKTFNDYDITLVLVSEVTDEDANGTRGDVQIGDMLFRIRRKDCPDSPPDMRSQIEFDDTLYKIVWHRKSSDLYVWDVYGREQ